MRKITIVSVLALAATAWAGSAVADPDKDESGTGRWRGGYERFDRGQYSGRGWDYRGNDGRRERRAFKQEWDDGNCKYERKMERSGEYKEEVKCRGGRRGGYPTYGARSYPPYGYRY